MSGPYDLEEQERLDAVRHWWEDNARQVYGAIVVLLLAVGGWRGYVFWSETQKEEASAMVSGLAKAHHCAVTTKVRTRSRRDAAVPGYTRGPLPPAP